MKKLLSVLTSTTITLSLLSAVSANAETDNNTDLSALAASLGSETDHLSRAALSYLEGPEIDDSSLPLFYYDSQYAVAVIQTLVHNGVIKASDIKEGASTLSEIEPDEAVNAIVSKYRASAKEIDTELYYGDIYCHTSQEDMIKKLIETAETSMKDNKYFVISIKIGNASVSSGRSSAFSTVGIGIADGSWSFNGKSYDKCILTLDPSSVKGINDTDSIQTSDDTNVGFQEENCIYINSETNEYVIPAKHNCDDANSDIYIICGDENILNYKGGISPSENFGADISNTRFIRMYNSSHMDYTINGQYTGTFGEQPKDLCDNYIYSYNKVFAYCDSTDTFSLETSAGKGAYTSNRTSVGLYVRSKNSNSYLNLNGEFFANIDDSKFEITKKSSSFSNEADHINSENEKYGIVINETEPSYKFSNYSISGRSKDTLTFEVKPNGIYIADSVLLRMNFDYNNNELQMEAIENGEQNGLLKITATEPVMLKYDDDTELWYIYRDSDNSGSFSEKVLTGDVNCDGKIDARDASLVLQAYAEISDGKTNNTYVDKRYADFTGDNKLSAADASAILAHYADSAAQ